jgi:hypothetical protein
MQRIEKEMMCGSCHERGDNVGMSQFLDRSFCLIGRSAIRRLDARQPPTDVDHFLFRSGPHGHMLLSPGSKAQDKRKVRFAAAPVTIERTKVFCVGVR